MSSMEDVCSGNNQQVSHYFQLQPFVPNLCNTRSIMSFRLSQLKWQCKYLFETMEKFCAESMVVLIEKPIKTWLGIEKPNTRHLSPKEKRRRSSNVCPATNHLPTHPVCRDISKSIPTSESLLWKCKTYKVVQVAFIMSKMPLSFSFLHFQLLLEIQTHRIQPKLKTCKLQWRIKVFSATGSPKLSANFT